MDKFYRNWSNEWFFRSKKYGEHVSAMTREDLDSKSDIAAELAYRDDTISDLQRELDVYKAVESKENDDDKTPDEKIYELSLALEKEKAHNKAMKLTIMKLLERWWPFVHGSVMPSETAKNLAQEARDAISGKY